MEVCKWQIFAHINHIALQIFMQIHYQQWCIKAFEHCIACSSYWPNHRSDPTMKVFQQEAIQVCPYIADIFTVVSTCFCVTVHTMTSLFLLLYQCEIIMSEPGLADCFSHGGHLAVKPDVTRFTSRGGSWKSTEFDSGPIMYLLKHNRPLIIQSWGSY